MGGCERARALQLAGPQSRPQARRVPVGRGAQHARGCLQIRRAGVANNRGAKHTGRGARQGRGVCAARARVAGDAQTPERATLFGVRTRWGQPVR